MPALRAMQEKADQGNVVAMALFADVACGRLSYIDFAEEDLQLVLDCAYRLQAMYVFKPLDANCNAASFPPPQEFYEVRLLETVVWCVAGRVGSAVSQAIIVFYMCIRGCGSITSRCFKPMIWPNTTMKKPLPLLPLPPALPRFLQLAALGKGWAGCIAKDLL